MIPITDEEAQNWPMSVTYFFCTECGQETNVSCDYCGYSICEQLDCIKAHAAKGCYTNLRHADDSRPNVNQDPPPDARPSDDSPRTVTEPALDAEVTEQPSVSKGR